MPAQMSFAEIAAMAPYDAYGIGVPYTLQDVPSQCRILPTGPVAQALVGERSATAVIWFPISPVAPGTGNAVQDVPS